MSDPTGPLDSASSRAASSRGRCMCVSVARSSYGLPLENVQEVIAVRPVTRVFHAPSALSGIINLRGEVLPVLDLSQLLGRQPSVPKLSDARIVVVRERTGLKRRVGLLVDVLLGLVDVPIAGLSVAPPAVSSAIRPVVVGVIPSSPPCAVLDVASLLDVPELSPLAGASSYQ